MPWAVPKRPDSGQGTTGAMYRQLQQSRERVSKQRQREKILALKVSLQIKILYHMRKTKKQQSENKKGILTWLQDAQRDKERNNTSMEKNHEIMK